LDKASKSIINKQGCGPVTKAQGNAVLDTETKSTTTASTSESKANRGGKEVNSG